MKHLLFILTGLVLVMGCNEKESENFTIEKSESTTQNKALEELTKDFNFNNYTWLNGRFRDTTYSEKEETHQSWLWYEDSIVMNGFFVKEKSDTTAPDKNVIKFDKGYYKFINTVKDKSVEFRLSAYGQDSLLFANPAHKYPQIIIYKKITQDSIHLILDGFVFQQRRKSVYNLKRYE